jgi:tetratricopeptide (TPR) repeat protein
MTRILGQTFGYDNGQGELTMQRIHQISALALLALAPAAYAVPDANGNLVDPAEAAAPDLSNDGAMQARLQYNLGFETFQKTTQLETAGASFSGAKAQENAQAVREGFRKARDNFRKAATAEPKMKEAWNMVGYTSRRVGDYEESLAAYDKALALAPDYPEAIEYRAELFVMTGRFTQAREAYAALQKSSPSYAATLKTAMKDFIRKGGTSPATPEERAAFATWVKSL